MMMMKMIMMMMLEIATISSFAECLTSTGREPPPRLFYSGSVTCSFFSNTLEMWTDER